MLPMDNRRAVAGTVHPLLSVLLLVVVAGLGGTPASAADQPVTYMPPDATAMSAPDLERYYAWRSKMDWLLAPIHTRSDLKAYLNATATAGSPLEVLSPDERQRFLSELEFGPHGAFLSYTGDLQYLSTRQVYRILALIGEQNLATTFTGGRVRGASPRAAPQPGGPSLIERRFAEYLACYLNPPARGENDIEAARTISQDYARWFASMQAAGLVRKIGNHDLRLLFRAAAIADSMSHDTRYARDAHRDFLEMERRHFAGLPDYQSMYQVFIDTWQFAAARAFYQAHPGDGLTPFPAYRDEATGAGKDAPGILVVNSTKRELIHRDVNLDEPRQVVILTSPDCEFCADLDAALQLHPKLRGALRLHTIWVTPPGAELDFDTLQKWNKAHPHMSLAIMYSRRGWPMVKMMAVPQLFFLRHGKVVKHILGCGTRCDLSALRSGLRALGLLK